MGKLCNVNARLPIYGALKTPIYGVVKNINLTNGQILLCINRGGIVEQVLSDGTSVRLNLSNYKTDFDIKIDNDDEEPEEQIPITDNENEITNGGNIPDASVINDKDTSTTKEENVPEIVVDGNKEENDLVEETSTVDNEEQVSTTKEENVPEVTVNDDKKENDLSEEAKNQEEIVVDEVQISVPQEKDNLPATQQSRTDQHQSRGQRRNQR